MLCLPPLFSVGFELWAFGVRGRKRQKLGDRVCCLLVISLTISGERLLGDVKLALNRLETGRDRRVARGGRGGRKEKAFFFFFPLLFGNRSSRGSSPPPL